MRLNIKIDHMHGVAREGGAPHRPGANENIEAADEDREAVRRTMHDLYDHLGLPKW
ncbi:MAG: hypothetical protein ABI112_13370 [Terracoccus sp.]